MREYRQTIPKLLVLDLTARGNATATGELKANLFSRWPDDRYLQIYFKDGSKLGVQHGSKTNQEVFSHLDGCKQILTIIDQFQPELILYRPVPDAQALHELAMSVIKARLNTPLVTWIVDDWPARLEAEDPVQFAKFHRDWLWLLKRSSLRLSIGDKMSREFKERYGYEFQPFANGVNPADWPEPRATSGEKFTVRYAGALADNMTAQSVLRVAEAIEMLANEGHSIQLEIRTRSVWKKRQEKYFSNLHHTVFMTDLLPPWEYRDWLRGADAVLIGYNFDADSLRYIGLSIANKLPECLASGAPLIAHGPREAATIEYVSSHKCALVLDVPTIKSVKDGIVELMSNDNLRKELIVRGREVAFQRHNLNNLTIDFMSRMADVAKSSSGRIGQVCADSNSLMSEFSRAHQAHIDESEVVSRMLRERAGPSHIMVDVGAHHGSSASHFIKLGWSIYCFEPDSTNRAKLTSKFSNVSNVVIDSRAVSDSSATGVALFSSSESSGISSLKAFHDTHHHSEFIDVTTVADIVEQYRLKRIDFLKIDVEGTDFNVLKGVPWERIKPDIIECEFEDKKTVPFGYSYKDVATYLIGNGYTVYISEWHPVIRYGIRHDWCRLTKYPEELSIPDAWGNLLAFRQDPGSEVVAEAFERCLSFRRHDKARAAAPTSSARAASDAKEYKPAAEKSLDSLQAIAQRMRAKVPGIFRVLQAPAWALVAAYRHKIETILFLIVCALIASVPFLHAPAWSWRYLFWGLSGLLIAWAAIMAIVLEGIRRLIAALKRD